MQPKKIEGRIKTKHMTEGLYHYFKMRARAERWNSKKGKTNQIKSNLIIVWAFERQRLLFLWGKMHIFKTTKKNNKIYEKLMKTTKLTLI